MKVRTNEITLLNCEAAWQFRQVAAPFERVRKADPPVRGAAFSLDLIREWL